jgi:hypothetical protein
MTCASALGNCAGEIVICDGCPLPHSIAWGRA